MRAETAEPLTPLAWASAANCCFHPSNPAAESPHCAALASPAAPASARAAAVVGRHGTIKPGGLTSACRQRADGRRLDSRIEARWLPHHRPQGRREGAPVVTE